MSSLILYIDAYLVKDKGESGPEDTQEENSHISTCGADGWAEMWKVGVGSLVREGLLQDNDTIYELNLCSMVSPLVVNRSPLL
jgi:hypothetical protein